MRRRAIAFAVVGACGAPLPSHAGLGGQTVARAGALDIPVDVVAGVAEERHTSAAVALDLLIDDAVAAKAALAEHLDRADDVRFAIVAATARATVQRARDEAHKAAPTDDEVKMLSKKHWIEVDAPETMLVVHAVARRPQKPDARAQAAAKEVAASIASAVAGATDAADFQAKASAVPHGDVEVVVQPLPPFTADGRVALPGDPSPLYTEFARAADSLRSPGATSGVVETEAGWHVIRLIERHPAQFVPFEERRKLFAEEVCVIRAHDTIEAMEKGRRSLDGVRVVEGVDALLAEALPAIRTERGEPAAVP